MTQTNLLQLTQQYMDDRKAGRNAQILDLCADNIVIYSYRHGTFTGKAEVAKYLNDHAFNGTWETAQSYKEHQTFVNGLVGIMWVRFPLVHGLFTFNTCNQIERIDLQRGHLSN